MSTRRWIQAAEATALIKSAAGHGTSIERVVFPTMEYKGAGLKGVSFIDCDVGRLSFAGTWFRSFVLDDCSFVSCNGSNHLRYRDLKFVRCQWERSELGGAWRSVSMRDCSFVATAVSDLKIQRSRLQAVQIEGLGGSGLIIQDSILERVRVAGSIRHMSLVDIRVNDLDLSNLEVIDGGYLGIVGGPMMPSDFPNSFAMSQSGIRDAADRLAQAVRPEVLDSVRNLLDGGFELEHIDHVRLDEVGRDGRRMSPSEQQAVLDVLRQHRVLRWPPAESPRH